jgi:hypothetical protein
MLLAGEHDPRRIPAMQFQVFDSLPVRRMDQTENLVLDDQSLVSYLLDKFPRPLESGSSVSVPLEDLGQ